jgi:hypothetical protein
VLLRYIVPEFHVNIRKGGMDKERSENESWVDIWGFRVWWEVWDGKLGLRM